MNLNSANKVVPIEEYEALKQEYEEFTYIVSHDFNAPMRHLREFSKLLISRLDGRINDEEKLYASFIEKSVKRNEVMLEALLQLSRLNTLAEEHKVIDCNEIISSIIKYKDDEISENEIEITYSKLPLIKGDENQITKLFYNLIDNAIKFRRKDVTPKINITVKEKDQLFEFCVEDNGIGIAEEMQYKVFKLFRKLNSDQDYAGAGTGLTVAKKIIERHGYKLWVESSPNQGSKFFFTFGMI